MRVLGIDPSTFMGLVLLGPQTEIAKVYNPLAKGFKRIALVGQMIASLITEEKPDVAVIEDYGFNMGNRAGRQSAATIVLQVEIGTLVRHSLYQAKVPWWAIRPTTLKQWTTGRGNAKKPEMAEAVCKRWGFESASDDIIDAYALARLGQELESTSIHKLLKGVTYEGQ